MAPETFNLGETSRGVEVARALRDDGHEVRFMGYSHRYADYIRDAGFPLDLLTPELSEADADQLIRADQGKTLRHPFTTEVVRERVASELELIESWRPDAIVIGTTLSMFLSARIAGVPLIYVRPWPMSSGHLRTMRSYPVSRVPVLNRMAAGLLRGVVGRVGFKPRSFRQVAAEHRLDLPRLTIDAIDGDLNLIASLFPHLDGRPLQPNEKSVGPIFARSDSPLPESVAALARRTRPVVYVGLGSSGNGRLARRILTRLGDCDVDVLTSTGTLLSPAQRRGLPGNVAVHDFLPAHRLGGLIDAAVIHGGEGTVQTMCSIGVPFAGIGLQAEQRINIDECVRHGNALALTPRQVRRGMLPGVVDTLLHDAALRDTAADLAVTMSDLDGAATSARLIADYVARESRELRES